MDQQELREIEKRCIQEEPPGCTAACPLHVDIRTFIRHVSKEDWDAAWKVLRRNMPFPGILGRICDAPCRGRCKRSQAGGAIEIGALERFCVSQPPPRLSIPPRPTREPPVAVVGLGLSGLTAAWDLLRKGYPVHLFHATDLVRQLLNAYPERLTEAIISEELAVLESLGAIPHPGADIHQAGFAETCRKDFQAIYLSLESVDPAIWGLDRDANGQALLAHPLQTASLPAIFAGGQNESPVRQAAEGRWAATSMDRSLQHVSLTAGREKDGPYETRLFTSLAGVSPVPPTPFSEADGNYTIEEARAEAARCLQCECLECVKVCAYLEAFKGYPKKYARAIYNNASIVMGSRQANRLINSCSLCGLCQVVCPEDFPMQDLCLKARQSMVQRGKMPPSAHEFALLDMAFTQSPRCYLARNEPGRGSSAFLFFPGCQLSGTRPEQTITVYNYLRSHLEGGVALMLGCCGAPAQWAGQAPLFGEQMDRLQQRWGQLGRPRLIAACATCLLMLKEHLPETDPMSLCEILLDIPLPRAQLRPTVPLAVHDPCTSRNDAKAQSALRQVLKTLGVPFEELELGRDKTECCGFGGLMETANPSLAREVVERRAGRSDADYLAWCAMCRDRLAGVGKRVIHVLDLLFPTGEEDPAARSRSGWSERQENRARLKGSVLKEIWGEGFERMEAHQKIRLTMTPEIRERLDQRRILNEDIQRVIHHAEETGDRLFHPETGRYKASYRPCKTTFWVEYTPGDQGYVIHNAYGHRMEVMGTGQT